MEQSAQVLAPLYSRYNATSENEYQAILEGAAMAGFVGILRQLGDLAQLATEVFHGLHDQVTAASARARELTLRARQLEAELPLIEEHLCRQERRSLQHVVASDMGTRCWRADVRVKRGAVAGGTRPRLIAERIERCRGPPELSMLDKYDADGEGACLKRYTDPSFFRTHSACSTKHALFLQGIEPTFQSSDNSKLPPKAAHNCSELEKDASENSEDGQLSMFRQLKHRQTNESILRIIEPHMHKFHNEDSSEEKASTTHHSEANMLSSTDSPEISRTKVTGIAVNEERTCDLERTSSFQAWLSPPDAAPTPEREITQETSQDTNSSGFVSHVASSGADLVGANKGKENSNATRNDRNFVEFITSRVSNLPRKLSFKKHDPLTESFRNMAKKLLQLRYDTIRDNGSYDFEPDREDHDASDKEATENSENEVSSKDVPDLDEFVFDNKSTEYTQQQVISEQSDEPCELACPPASVAEEASDSVTNCNPKETNLPMLATKPVFSCDDTSMPNSKQWHLHGLHQPIIHQEQNCCSEDITILSLPPIPPMQWLSVKVHIGSGIASPKLRTLGQKSPVISRAAKSNPLQPVRKQIQASSQDSSWTSRTEIAHTLVSNEDASADISHTDGVFRDLFLGKEPEGTSHRESLRKDAALTSEGKDSVCFTGVEQLRSMSPPSVPRPKYSLAELRTAPSLIYPSRALSGKRSILLEQMKNRSINLKPVPGGSPDAMVDPRNSKVVVILQRADGIRQAHADDDDINSNDTWSDSD